MTSLKSSGKAHGRVGHREDEHEYQVACFARWLANLPDYVRNNMINRMYLTKSDQYMLDIESRVQNELIAKRRKRNG